MMKKKRWKLMEGEGQVVNLFGRKTGRRGNKGKKEAELVCRVKDGWIGPASTRVVGTSPARLAEGKERVLKDQEE